MKTAYLSSVHQLIQNITETTPETELDPTTLACVESLQLVAMRLQQHDQVLQFALNFKNKKTNSLVVIFAVALQAQTLILLSGRSVPQSSPSFRKANHKSILTFTLLVEVWESAHFGKETRCTVFQIPNLPILVCPETNGPV